jgi:hypothetical protein
MSFNSCTSKIKLSGLFLQKPKPENVNDYEKEVCKMFPLNFLVSYGTDWYKNILYSITFHFNLTLMRGKTENSLKNCSRISLSDFFLFPGTNTWSFMYILFSDHHSIRKCHKDWRTHGPRICKLTSTIFLLLWKN